MLFGNIGLPERVSFSVIGSIVNEVARLEALTKQLGRQILATGAFAGHTSIMRTISVAISFAASVRL